MAAFHPNLPSAFDPLQTLDSQAIHPSVSVHAFLDVLSKRAPVIVVITLCAALVSAWSGVPEWLNNGLAISVGILALVLLASRGRQNQFKTAQELGFSRSRDWIVYELAGKGSPPGFYPLGFFGLVTIVLTGLQSPSSKLAWAGFFLGVVWGIVNARYPADEASER
jgi:hypothetical protein